MRTHMKRFCLWDGKQWTYFQCQILWMFNIGPYRKLQSIWRMNKILRKSLDMKNNGMGMRSNSLLVPHRNRCKVLETQFFLMKIKKKTKSKSSLNQISFHHSKTYKHAQSYSPILNVSVHSRFTGIKKHLFNSNLKTTTGYQLPIRFHKRIQSIWEGSLSLKMDSSIRFSLTKCKRKQCTQIDSFSV